MCFFTGDNNFLAVFHYKALRRREEKARQSRESLQGHLPTSCWRRFISSKWSHSHVRAYLPNNTRAALWPLLLKAPREKSLCGARGVKNLFRARHVTGNFNKGAEDTCSRAKIARDKKQREQQTWKFSGCCERWPALWNGAPCTKDFIASLCALMMESNFAAANANKSERAPSKRRIHQCWNLIWNKRARDKCSLYVRRTRCQHYFPLSLRMLSSVRAAKTLPPPPLEACMRTARAGAWWWWENSPSVEMKSDGG